MDFRVGEMVQTGGRAICTALRLLLSQTRLLSLPRAQRLAALGRRAHFGRKGARFIAMTLQKRKRRVSPGSNPGRRQLADLGTLYSQAFRHRVARRPQLRAVAVEHVKIEAVFAAVPVADLGGVRRQVGLFVTQRLASPHVGLRVLDGEPTLGEALGNVQPIAHCQAIRAAAYCSASA